MFKKLIYCIFFVFAFALFVNVPQTFAQPLTDKQLNCYLNGTYQDNADPNDPFYKKYFDICWKQTGAVSTGAIINCMNTYPEFVEWDKQNKAKCQDSQSPSPDSASGEDNCSGRANIDGHDIAYFCKDMDACDKPHQENLTKCQLIADECVQSGGCNPMLASLIFMGCDKCDAKAKPCFDQNEATYKQCRLAAAAKYNPKYEDFSCKRSQYGICIPGTEKYDDKDPETGERDCHDSCQENLDDCTYECKSPDASPSATNNQCFTVCDQAKSSCSQNCRETWATANTQSPPTPTEAPSVGVSSRNFLDLVKYHRQLQVAQANLDQIKTNNDPRWNDKKDYAANNQDVPPDKLLIARQGAEWVKDAASLYQDVKDFADYYKKGDLGEYTGTSLAIDVGNGLIDYMDMINDGVPPDLAATKAFIDTAAPNGFKAFPPLYAADKIATMPDAALGLLGISEQNGVRQVTGYLANNSPSEFIKLSTNAMVTTQNWTNLGAIVMSAVDDFNQADGPGEKLSAGVDLVGTAVGAVPVAAALGVKEFLFGQPIGQRIVGSIYNLFTN